MVCLYCLVGGHLTKGTIALTVGSLFPGVLTRHLCTKPMVIASIQEQQKVH